MKSVIIANITWNPFHWRAIYRNPHAGHRYVRNKPGHESLNFKFDKPIDTNGKIFGHVQWTNPPKDFTDGGIIIFYSRNTETNSGEIVGIYGGVTILRPPIETPYPGFENNRLYSSVEAEEKYSILFPMPLSDKKYKGMLNTNRLVPQTGFRIIDDIRIADTIVSEEISSLKRSGMRFEEKQKLEKIYEFIVGRQYQSGKNIVVEDLEEQDELLVELKRRNENQKDKLIADLKNIKPSDPEIINIGGKTYKRDTKTILSLKILREFKCQICSKKILKANGEYYIEAAHIIPKREKGPETPENIIILCPNHHKEFDFGKKEVLLHNKEVIKFRLNGCDYSAELNF